MKRFVALLPIFTFILFLCSMPRFVFATEPDLQQWFNENSYIIDVATNKTGMGTFPAGEYRATIRAEFALYAPNNTFGWYSTATGTLHQLFAGEDTTGDTIDFLPTETFGVYIGSPDGTFYSEKSRNSDQSDHAWVFLNPKAEGGYVIAWEDMVSGGDKDYQDMTIVMQALHHPCAAFNWFPTNPQPNETITFNASASTPEGGTIINYEWDFGDSSPTKSGIITTHNYVALGNYTVALNVTDSEGMNDTTSHMVTVVAPPQAAFSYTPPRPQAGDEVTFNASESKPNGGTLVNYNWDFGDGSKANTSIPFAFHTYAAFGDYDVTLDVTDSGELRASITHSIIVAASPLANFTYSPIPAKAKEEITFNASESKANGGNIISYEWNFNDGSVVVFGEVTVHQFKSSGNYTVTINVTDSEGLWDAESKTIQVEKPAIEAEFAVKIEDEWTLATDPYVFAPISYGKTFKAEVRIDNVEDLHAYEFWLEFNPAWIQLATAEVEHIHTEDNVTLQIIDNIQGVYKQAVEAVAPAQPYNGSAPVATFWFLIVNDPCYPTNFTGTLRLQNTKMTDRDSNNIDHLWKDGYFNILSAQPLISIEHEGSLNMTNWIANSTFIVDVNLSNIVRMKGFSIEITWGECLETDIQNVEVTSFLPQPYEIYRINISDTTLSAEVRLPDEKPAVNGTGTLLRITFKARNPWNTVPPYSLVSGTYLPDRQICKVTIQNGWIDIICSASTKMEFDSTAGVGIRNEFEYAFTPIPGDLDLDGEVSGVDLSAISQWTGIDLGDLQWSQCQQYDLTRDGRIDIFDIVIVSSNIGRTQP